MRICDIAARHHTEPPTVQIDFDGTIAHHHSGQAILGEPIENGVGLARELFRLGYRVIILTANPAPDLVGQWCVKHGVPFTAVTSNKQPAIAYVDDRAVHFDKGTPVDEMVRKVEEMAGR